MKLEGMARTQNQDIIQAKKLKGTLNFFFKLWMFNSVN